MKWVASSIAVLVALVIGIAIGWVMRARADEPLWRQHVASLSSTSPPPPTLPAPLPSSASPTPPVTTAKPRVWIDDTEAFAWPTSASDDVVVVDATHYLVKRPWLVKVTSNNELATSTRIIPAYVDGGVVGVKVFGIRVGTAAARLGLKNGDTVQTLNGVSLASPDDALEAYTHVRDGKTFVLGIERAGAPVQLHYRVLD